MSELRQRRLDKGLCPNCGEEAAPYRLCSHCRGMQSLGRLLKRAESHGLVNAKKQGKSKVWSISHGDNRSWSETLGSRPMPLWGEGRGLEDGRTRPRLGNIPVDVEAELIELIKANGGSATIEEIYMAWGRLREKRKQGTAANDMAALIQAQRRRDRRNEKRRMQRG